MTATHKPRDEIFVVIRHDAQLAGTEHEFAVKEAVWSEALAAAEVARLNALNADKAYRYFYQWTRLYPPGTSAGTTEARTDADAASA